MQVGRFINKLVDDRLEFYQTEGAESLLRKANLEEVWNLAKEGAGEYERFYADDMAVTRTIITLTQDSNGRMMNDADTIIVKFDFSDAPLILQLLNENLKLTARMQTAQRNSDGKLRNPLSIPNLNVEGGETH